MFFQGQGGTLNLSVRDQVTYVNAIIRNEKTTNTRLSDDKALSRVTIANRKDIHHAALPLRAEKSENLILICNFIASGVLQIIYTSRELTLSSRFELEAGLKGSDDNGTVTSGNPRGTI